MSTELILFVLRGAAALLLIAFLGAVMVILWRDYRAATAVVAASSRRRGRLVVIKAGDGALDGGESFPLLPLTSLGRAPTNTIVLHDSFCSQEHALVTQRGGQWWLEDRRSSNGTHLNGDPVRQPVVVSSGDVIGIGQVELKIELD